MKVVIIGLGSIAQKHIYALRKIDHDVELIALRHSRNSSNFEGVKNIYSYEEIVREKPDFVIISNPTIEHYSTLEKLSGYHIPLFIEKPLFATIGDKEDKLVSSIVNSKVPTYVACNLRFHKGVIEVKKLLKGKRIEEVNIYCGSYLPDWRPNVDFRQVYSANKKMGGGVHIDLIHELDYLYWIFGEPNNTRALFKNNSSLNITAYDYANYLWEYDRFCASVILNYYRKDAKRTFEILTDKGTYELDLIKNKITYGDKVIFDEAQEVYDMYYNQMLFFLSDILKAGKKFNPIQEASKVLKLCLTV